MKYLMIALLAFPALAQAHGSVHVQGYAKSNGTYVAPHERSAPNGTAADNWSTKGNVNPYTGQAGTHNPNPPAQPSYGNENPEGSD